MSCRYGDFVPYSLMGRIWVLAVIVSGAFLVAQLVSSVLSALAAGRRGTGTFTKSCNRHVILCGNVKWEFFVQFVVELYAIPSDDQPMLVVLHTAPFGTEGDQSAAELWNGFVQSAAVPDHVRYKLVYLEGDATSSDALDRARVSDAASVFVLCNQHSEDTVGEDSATLKRVLTIRAVAPAVPVYAMVALRDSMLQISFALSPTTVPSSGRGARRKGYRPRRAAVRVGPPTRPRRRTRAARGVGGDGAPPTATSSADRLSVLTAERSSGGGGDRAPTASLPWSTASTRASVQSGTGGDDGGDGSVGGGGGGDMGDGSSSTPGLSSDLSTPLSSLPSSTPSSPSSVGSSNSSASRWSPMSSREWTSDSSVDAPPSSSDSINLPDGFDDTAPLGSAFAEATPSSAQLSEAVCMQEVEMGLLAENVFCNGLSTLLCNLCQQGGQPADPNISPDNPSWMYEYGLGSECGFCFTSVPDSLTGWCMADVAVALYDLGLVLLAVRHRQRPGAPASRWATVGPSTVFRRGDTAIAITYHKPAAAAESFESASRSLHESASRSLHESAVPYPTEDESTTSNGSVLEQSTHAGGGPAAGSVHGVVAGVSAWGAAAAADPMITTGNGDHDIDFQDVAVDLDDDDGFGGMSMEYVAEEIVSLPRALSALPHAAAAAVRHGDSGLLRRSSGGSSHSGADVTRLEENSGPMSSNSSTKSSASTPSPAVAALPPPPLADTDVQVPTLGRSAATSAAEPPLASVALAASSSLPVPLALPLVPVAPVRALDLQVPTPPAPTAPALELSLPLPSQLAIRSGSVSMDKEELSRLREERWQGPSQWKRRPDSQSAGSDDTLEVVGSAASTAAFGAGHAAVAAAGPVARPVDAKEGQDGNSPASGSPPFVDRSTSRHDSRTRSMGSHDAPDFPTEPDGAERRASHGRERRTATRRLSRSSFASSAGGWPSTGGARRGSSKAVLSAAAFAAAGGRNLILYGARPLPVRLRSHIVVCLLGSMAVGNLRVFLECIWQPRDGGRAPRTPVVAVSAAFTAADEANLRKFDKSPLFLVRGNSLAIPTLRRAQYGSAKAILILACESRPRQHTSDSRALFTVMTLDHLLTTNSSVFVCCMLDAEASMALLRAPANPRRQGTTLGVHTEPAMMTRTPAVASWVRLPSGMPSPAASFLGLPRTYSGYSVPGMSTSAGVPSSPGPFGGGGGYAYASRTPAPGGASDSEAYRNLAGGLSSASLFNSALYGGASSTWGGSQRNLRFDSLGPPYSGGPGGGGYAGGSMVLGDDPLTVSAHAETQQRQRYASGEVLLSSALLALAVREFQTPGLMAAVRTVFGVGVGTRARSTRCWVRALPIPRSWLWPGDESDWEATDDGSNASGVGGGGRPLHRVYRDLYQALLPLGALPIGLYRAGDAVFRVRVSWHGPVGSVMEHCSSNGSLRGGSGSGSFSVGDSVGLGHSRRSSWATLSPTLRADAAAAATRETDPLLSAGEAAAAHRLASVGACSRRHRRGAAGSWSLDQHMDEMQAELDWDNGLSSGAAPRGGSFDDVLEAADERLPMDEWDDYAGDEVGDDEVGGPGELPPHTYVCPTAGNVIYYQQQPSTRSNRLPYVYTNPEPFTLLSPLDAVYVLVDPDTHVPNQW